MLGVSDWKERWNKYLLWKSRGEGARSWCKGDGRSIPRDDEFWIFKKRAEFLVNGLAKVGWGGGGSDGLLVLLPPRQQEAPLGILPTCIKLLRLDPPRLSCQGVDIRWGRDLKSFDQMKGGRYKSLVSCFLVSSSVSPPSSDLSSADTSLPKMDSNFSQVRNQSSETSKK